MKEFAVETSLAKDIMILSLSGELDASSSQRADKALENAIESNIKSLLINCHNLDYISSAGLGVFLAHHQTYRSRGVNLIFYGMQPKIRNIFEIVGLQNVFTIISSYEDAITLASS